MGAQSGRTYAIGSTQQVRTPAKRITLDLHDVPLREALKAVEVQGGITLVYASGALPLDRRITARVSALPVDEALRAVLRGVDVEIRESGSGQVMLVKRMSHQDDSASGEEPKTGMLTGHVVDSATRLPVIKATVTLDQGSFRATTNDAGQYSLPNVPGGTHRISVQRIGYAPAVQTVIVRDGETTSQDFLLVAVASRLDEVVTTVTGAQRRLEIGNVIGAINADSVVREAPVMSLSDVINARVSGVQVILNNGLAGTGPRIRIRGLNSLTVSNDPLLVVDGIRVENSSGAINNYGQTSGRLNDLNPDEIESIEIVKGPSAATLYGTDAANGVIVVKTKRGQAGRAKWTAFMERGLAEQVARFPDNYYAWGHNSVTGAIQQCVLAQVATSACQVDSLTTFNPLTNSVTSPIGTGSVQQYGAQVSGGVAPFTYFLAAEYQDEIGLLRMPDIDRARVQLERGGVAIPEDQVRPNALRAISLRSNAGTTFGSTGEVNLTLGIVSRESRIPGNEIFQSGLVGPGYRSAQDGWVSFLSRPGESFAVRNSEDVTRYTSSVNTNWHPLNWLSTRVTGGIDFTSSFLDELQRRGEGPLGAGRNGRRFNSRTNVSQYSAELGASALFDLQSHVSSKTSVGAQYNRRYQEVTAVTGTNLPPGSETVAGAATLTGSEQTIESIVAGAYAEQTIGFHERLFLVGALRADGGSAFGRDFRTALYPKAGVSWLAVEERPGILNSVRLRTAYGASGVQPASTAALELITVAQAVVDGVSLSGARLSAIGNPMLKPERQTELEAGLDAEFFAHRLKFEGTYYDRLSRDALINRPLASEVGLAARQENIGSVSNRGIEGLISATALENKTILWEVTLNGSLERNRLERIGAGITSIPTANPVYQSREGYPLFSIFARPLLGFADENDNGIIEEGELQVGDSVVSMGPALPSRQLSTSSTIGLFDGRLRIGAQFDYRGGYRLVNYTELNRCAVFASDCRAVNDVTTPLADQASAVAYNSTRFGQTRAGYVQDASFVRWREIAITYVAPATMVRRIGASSVAVSLSGRNLHLFTRYSGIDPEVNATPGPGNHEGYNDSLTAPQSRYWLFRVNLGF